MHPNKAHTLFYIDKYVHHYLGITFYQSNLPKDGQQEIWEPNWKDIWGGGKISEI